MTAEEYKAYQMYSNNEYAGIGVTIQLDDKTKGFRITAVTSDSPAANAGLKQGDIILSIDGEDVTGKTLSEVQTIIRAKLNKTLKLTVQDTAGKSRTVTLDCTVIYTDPVTYKLMDNGVGYVRIRNFETAAARAPCRRSTSCSISAQSRWCSICATTPAVCSRSSSRSSTTCCRRVTCL